MLDLDRCGRLGLVAAPQTGLFVGDVLTDWNGEAITSVREVFKKLGPDAVGSTVVLGLVRAGHEPDPAWTLRAGQLVFTGGLTAPVPVTAGVTVTAEFDGLGSVEVYGR